MASTVNLFIKQMFFLKNNSWLIELYFALKRANQREMNYVQTFVQLIEICFCDKMCERMPYDKSLT